MFTDPFGLKADSVKVQWHEVAGGQYHAFVSIRPDNAAKWSKDPRFGGRSFITLGAGPVMKNGDLKLVSDKNRPNDVRPHSGGVVVAAGAGEDAVIERLLTADAAYADNLPYAFFPAPGSAVYNSNGYVAGLLNAAGLGSPNVPVDVPGFNNPVPAEAFR